jgi:diguanylate cyclase (GGDEF)-like protein
MNQNAITSGGASRNLASYIPAALTAVVGVALSLVAFSSVHRWETRLSELRFQQLARDRQQTINSSLGYATEVLHALRAYYDAPDREITRPEYQIFAKTLRERLPGLRNTGFARRVTRAERGAFEHAMREQGFPDFEIWERDAQGRRMRAADRPDYYPIVFPDPVQYTNQIIGFDIASEPLRNAALQRARRSGDVAVTPPINLITKKEPDGFMSFIPVFAKGATPETAEPNGYMYGVYGTGPVVENILSVKSLPLPVDIYFFDPARPMGDRLIYWHSAPTRATPAPVPDEAALLAGPHWTGEIRLGDQAWGAIFVPSAPASGQSGQWQAFFALSAGLIMTAMVVLFLVATLRQNLRSAYQARHDALTQLANRAMFVERINQAVDRAQRLDEPFNVLIVDLDKFKDINDNLGHLMGDALLRAVSQRLCECVSEADTVARLGGDEFAILQSVNGDPEALATTLAKAVTRAVGIPFDLDGHWVNVGVSVGIAMAPRDGLDRDRLLRHADLALYSVKANGRNGYRFFDHTLVTDRQQRNPLHGVLDAVAHRDYSQTG